VDLSVQLVRAAGFAFHWDLDSGLVVVESVDLEDRGSLEILSVDWMSIPFWTQWWHFTVNFRIPMFESVISLVGIPMSLEKCPDVLRIGQVELETWIQTAHHSFKSLICDEMELWGDCTCS
jgi:hypothetical protein